MDMEIVSDGRRLSVRESKNLMNSIQSSFIAGKHVEGWLENNVSLSYCSCTIFSAIVTLIVSNVAAWF